MTADGSSDQDEGSTDHDFVEIDPTGRYGRYSEVLGKGAYKKVYKAFDEMEGMEVAWNQVKLKEVFHGSEELDHPYPEVHLLQNLNHMNIIKLYAWWVDSKQKHINFITEIFTSGNLRQYRSRHKKVDMRALKNWSRQILQGLHYLHSNDPPVIHRDLKCENIFVNGNQGEVKIGDLGLAAILCHSPSARSVIGTPEFMAPELYEEQYNELVDIYAFGMCLLELVTFEYPYSECSNAAQIYKKVVAGIKPASLAKVKDPEVKTFIEKCIASASDRLPAVELLMDPFLSLDDIDYLNYPRFPCLNNTGNFLKKVAPLEKRLSETTNAGANSQQTERKASFSDINTDPSTYSKDFTVEGQRKDINTIFLKLKIADSTGHVHKIHFPFDIKTDTSISVANEMVAELNLTDQDANVISAMIDSEIQSLVPDWVDGETSRDHYDDEVKTRAILVSEMKNEVSALPTESGNPSGGFVLERLPSGRKYWSDSPKESNGDSPRRSQSYFLSGSNPCISSQGDHHPNPTFSVGVKDKTNMVITEPPNAIATDVVAQEDEVAKSTFSLSGDTKNGTSDHEKMEESELDHLKDIVDKLEHLLIEQQRELHELQRKHDEAVEDILKELPPELQKRTLCRCRLKVPDVKAHSGMGCYEKNSQFSDPSSQ